MGKSVYEERYQNSPNAHYLHAKRMQIYQEMNLARMKDPEFGMSTLEYMKAKYPEETELIALEELRVAENQKIYEEYRASGDPRTFREYASQEYGFNDIDEPEVSSRSR